VLGGEVEGVAEEIRLDTAFVMDVPAAYRAPQVAHERCRRRLGVAVEWQQSEHVSLIGDTFPRAESRRSAL
jgi:hypothetical protein